MTSLSLVIPAYNEADRIAPGLTLLKDFVSIDDVELIVVDDGSTDDTALVAAEALASWPRSTLISLPENSGKGAAVKAGVKAATGARIIFLDADMATDLHDFDALLSRLDDSHVSIGSRSHHESKVGPRGTLRTFMNRTFSLLVALATRLPFTDTQCGFKAFRGPVAKLLFHGAQLDRFAFDVEVLDLAVRWGLTIEFVPVHWTDIKGSHVRPARHGLEMARDVVAMRFHRGSIPPVFGILFPEERIDDAAMVLAAVGDADLVVKYGDGVAVLYPCQDLAGATASAERLRQLLPTLPSEPLALDYAKLLAPAVGSPDRRVEVTL